MRKPTLKTLLTIKYTSIFFILSLKNMTDEPKGFATVKRFVLIQCWSLLYSHHDEGDGNRCPSGRQRPVTSSQSSGHPCLVEGVSAWNDTDTGRRTKVDGRVNRKKSFPSKSGSNPPCTEVTRT